MSSKFQADRAGCVGASRRRGKCGMVMCLPRKKAPRKMITNWCLISFLLRFLAFVIFLDGVTSYHRSACPELGNANSSCDPSVHPLGQTWAASQLKHTLACRNNRSRELVLSFQPTKKLRLARPYETVRPTQETHSMRSFGFATADKFWGLPTPSLV